MCCVVLWLVDRRQIKSNPNWTAPNCGRGWVISKESKDRVGPELDLHPVIMMDNGGGDDDGIEWQRSE